MKAYPSYKTTEVDWLGDIPEHWDTRKTKYLFCIRKRIAGEVGHQVLSITQTGIKVKDTESGEGQLSMDYSKYQLVYVGDFAMNHMDLLTGYVDISKYDGVVSPDYRVFTLEDKNSFDKYYLYLFQIGYKNKIFYALGQGSSQLGRWRLPSEEFSNFQFPYPSPAEQRTIASHLDQKTILIDKLVSAKEKQIELLKEHRTAIINQAVTKGLNPKAKMKDSGIEWLGEIPEHWIMSKIKFIKADAKNSFVDGPFGSNLKSEHYIEGGDVYVIESNFATTGILDEDELKTISLSHFETISRSETNENDIIIAKIGARFGLSSVLPKLSKKSVVSGNSLKLTVSGKHAIKFIHYGLLSLKLNGAIDLMASTTAQPALSLGELNNLHIPIPPKDEQESIVSHLDNKTSQIDKFMSDAEKQIELLKGYKTAMISEAVTGKIDIRGN